MAAMVTAWVVLFMLPILVSSTGDGNIHLMEDDVAEALRACSQMNSKRKLNTNGTRRRRFDTSSDNHQIPLIDANAKEDVNPYSHIRRKTVAVNQQISNGTNYNFSGYGVGSAEDSFINSAPRPVNRRDNNSSSYHYAQNQRVKRNERLINKNDNDQCLSRCVFANLHMVDSKGIPRESEVWNRIQTSVASQQSSILLRDQIRACFQELQSESEDDGCSYSNKLEHCLTLRLSDRKMKESHPNTSSRN